MTLELKGFSKYFPLLIIPFFLIVGIIMLTQTFKVDSIFPKLFVTFWLGGVIYNAYKFSKMVTHIELLNNDLKFKTILGKEYQLFTSDFTFIKITNNMIDFKTNNGNFVSLGNFDGFSEFIVALKKANPNLVTKGC